MKPHRTTALSREECERRIALVEECLQEGFLPKWKGGGEPVAIGEAARREGITLRAFKNNLERAKFSYGLEPDWSLHRPPRYQQPVARLHVVPAPPPSEVIRPFGEISRHLVIPDEHNDPRHPHRVDVQLWIARYGAEHRHDTVVKLGDSATFDSVSRHDKDDTVRGRMKPPIKDDLENHRASLRAFERGQGEEWKPRKRKARGNHEQRLYDFENATPAADQTFTLAYEEHLAQFGWYERPFGEVFYIDGIGYTHCPINGVGRPMGGKTATHRAGAMLTAPLVYGHTHKFQIFHDAKIGLVEKIAVIEAGCCLPTGEIESYALHSPTGWSHGIVDLTIQAGQVTDFAFVSIETLRRRYSDDGADVRA